jgi:hypothetical protein
MAKERGMVMDEKTEKAMQELSEISERFQAAMKVEEEHQEQYWNSLTKEQQLMVFCAISRRIFDGEIKQGGSYRYVLYDVFEFGPEAYVPAQCAGYLDIHNAIYTGKDEERLLKEFAEFAKIDEELVSQYLQKKYF